MRFFDYFKNVKDCVITEDSLIDAEVISDKCIIDNVTASNVNGAVLNICDQDVTFERCIFKDFSSILMFICGKCNVTFKNCYFENIKDGITSFDNAVVKIDNCQFNNVENFCLKFLDNSTYVINHMKVENLVGCAVVMDNKSSGCIENTSFITEKKCVKVSSGICLYGENTVKLNKCKFKNLGFGYLGFNKATALINECDFVSDKTSIASFESSTTSLYSSHFSKHKEICCYGKDDASINIYDSEFSGNKKECIQLEGKAILNVYNSKFLNNKTSCIDLTEDANGHIYESSIGENHGVGVLLENNSICYTSKSKLYNNDLGNIITLHSSRGDFVNNDIYYDKDSKEGSEQINMNCQQTSKCYLENNRIYGYEKEHKTVIGILTSDKADVFVKGCTLKTLWAVGLYEDSSQLCLTDSLIKDFYDVYAQGDPTAVFKTIRCTYEDCDKSFEMD